MNYKKVDHPERPCSICGDEFKPKTKRSIICESKDCKRERYKLYQREYHQKYHGKRMEDPRYRKMKAEYQKDYYAEKSKDPEFKEREKRRRKEKYHEKKEGPGGSQQ